MFWKFCLVMNDREMLLTFLLYVFINDSLRNAHFVFLDYSNLDAKIWLESDQWVNQRLDQWVNQRVDQWVEKMGRSKGRPMRFTCRHVVQVLLRYSYHYNSVHKLWCHLSVTNTCLGLACSQDRGVYLRANHKMLVWTNICVLALSFWANKWIRGRSICPEWAAAVGKEVWGTAGRRLSGVWGKEQ